VPFSRAAAKDAARKKDRRSFTLEGGTPFDPQRQSAVPTGAPPKTQWSTACQASVQPLGPAGGRFVGTAFLDEQTGAPEPARRPEPLPRRRQGRGEAVSSPQGPGEWYSMRCTSRSGNAVHQEEHPHDHRAARLPDASRQFRRVVAAPRLALRRALPRRLWVHTAQQVARHALLGPAQARSRLNDVTVSFEEVLRRVWAWCAWCALATSASPSPGTVPVGVRGLRHLGRGQSLVPSTPCPRPRRSRTSSTTARRAACSAREDAPGAQRPSPCAGISPHPRPKTAPPARVPAPSSTSGPRHRSHVKHDGRPQA
jgi:hypothetical protein